METTITNYYQEPMGDAGRILEMNKVVFQRPKALVKRELKMFLQFPFLIFNRFFILCGHKEYSTNFFYDGDDRIRPYLPIEQLAHPGMFHMTSL